jgi:hypothetical protein
VGKDRFLHRPIREGAEIVKARIGQLRDGGPLGRKRLNTFYPSAPQGAREKARDIPDDPAMVSAVRNF